MNGGTEIIGYQIQLDDGNNGPFTTVLGQSDNTLDTEVTVSSGIVKGKTYRARYRAINSIGPGPWSPIAYIAASTVPKAPPMPIVTEVDNTKVVLSLSETTDDGGSSILSYHLYINEGVDGSAYHAVTTYDGSSLTTTINVGTVYGTMTVSLGLVYTFKFTAENAMGPSDDSNLL